MRRIRLRYRDDKYSIIEFHDENKHDIFTHLITIDEILYEMIYGDCRKCELDCLSLSHSMTCVDERIKGAFESFPSKVAFINLKQKFKRSLSLIQCRYVIKLIRYENS